MQHGIYYAYWEHEWKGEYEYYVEKVARLGFDILEIAAGPLPGYTDALPKRFFVLFSASLMLAIPERREKCSVERIGENAAGRYHRNQEKSF